MSRKTPPVRLYKTDGRKYPDVRPDGLVKQCQIQQMFGLGRNTLWHWQKKGWLLPVKREGHCALYEVPTPEYIAELKEKGRLLRAEGSRNGGERRYLTSDTSPWAPAREARQDLLEQRREQGWLTKTQLREALGGVHLTTITAWVQEGLLRPVHTQGGRSWFVMPDEDQLKAMGARSSRVALKLGVEYQPVDAIASECPEGMISVRQIQEVAGVCRDTLNMWIRKGLFPPPAVRGTYRQGYWHPSALECIDKARREMLARSREGSVKGGSVTGGIRKATALSKPPKEPTRREEGAKKSPPGPKPIATKPLKELPRIAPSVEPTSLKARETPLPPDHTPYEDAVAAGKANPSWATVLGFNVLKHPQLGYRTAPVTEKPEGGWTYYERHHLNGFKRWAMRQMSAAGQVSL